MPKASVIITLYNKGPYIKRAIKSVLNQTVKDIEIIVVNDGSIDNGPDVIKKIKDKRIILINQKNQGVGKAANRGVKEANSNFITFLDADDELTENNVETLLRLRKKFPEAGVYTQTYLICTDSGKLIKNKHKNIPPSPWEGILSNYFRCEIDGSHPISTDVVGIPKDIFFEMSGFDEHAHWGSDLDLWARIALKYPVAFSWNVGAIYHKEATNRLSSSSQPIHYHPLIINGKKAIKNNEIPLKILPDFKEYIARKQIQVIAKNIIEGGVITAKKMVDQVDTKRFYFDLFKCRIYSRLPPYVYKFIHRWKFIFRPLRIL